MNRLFGLFHDPTAVAIQKCLLKLLLMTTFPVDGTWAFICTAVILGSRMAKLDKLYHVRHVVYLSILSVMLTYNVACFLVAEDHFLIRHRFIFDLTAYSTEQSGLRTVAYFHRIAILILLVTLSNHVHIHWAFSGTAQIQVALLSNQLHQLASIEPVALARNGNQIRLYTKYDRQIGMSGKVCKYLEQFTHTILCAQRK